MKHIIILDHKNYLRLTKLSNYVEKFGWECYRCRRKLNMGEKVVSVRGHGKTRYYCLSCAKDLYYISKLLKG